MINFRRQLGIGLSALALVALLLTPALAQGLVNLPKAKWSATGKQPGLKGDMLDIERGILESFELGSAPLPVWVDVTSVKVPATADSPARVMMAGFPDVLHPGQFLPAGLSDGKYRVNTGDVTMDFDVATTFWGTEKASQYYALYALAANADAAFTLTAMPYLRMKSQATQVISLGTNLTPATGIGYGFTTNVLINGKIYVLSGASRGLLRSITANNNDNGTDGTITYGGAALTLAQGDWFIVLPPPGTNFRWLADIFNNASSNITEITDVIFGLPQYLFTANGNWLCPVTWTGGAMSTGIGGGAYSGGDSGSSNKAKILPVPGNLYSITIGLGSGTGTGGTTSLGALISYPGGSWPVDSTLNAPLWGFGGVGNSTHPSGFNGCLLIEKY